MSYESQLDNQSGKLINPAKLCFFLSIALHLLVLKFGLPTLRFNDDSGTREVSLVELNAEQQARLPKLFPQLETPELPDLEGLPELNNSEFDGSEPAAPFAIPRDLFPGIVDAENLPPLIIPPPPQLNLPNLPPITDITLPPIGDLAELPLPPAIDLKDFQIEPIKLPPNAEPLPESPPQPPETQLEDPPTPTAEPEPQATETAPEELPPEEEKPAEPQLTPEQIAALKEKNAQQRIQNLRQSLTQNEGGTSDEDARKNYIVWLAKVRDVEPEAIEIEGTYPRDACIRKLEGSSTYGVVVNAAGEVVALDLIKGAKYPIFNQQATRDLSDRLLANETEQPKPYRVKLNYEYDSEICPSLTLPSLRRAAEPETEAPEATEPEVKPEAEAESNPEQIPKPQPKPEPELSPNPEPEPESNPEPELSPNPEPKPLPSLRDRLRNIPLPNRKPADLKDIPLPEKPDFGN
ncbi:MAG: energy transducer TonB [Cyanobacteria bacterium J06621_8]